MVGHWLSTPLVFGVSLSGYFASELSAIKCARSGWRRIPYTECVRLARPTESDFPNGLETCSNPFTLRAQSILHSTNDEEHDALLRAAAQNLRRFLQDCGGTGRPILAPPDTAGQQALQVAKKTTFLFC